MSHRCEPPEQTVSTPEKVKSPSHSSKTSSMTLAQLRSKSTRNVPGRTKNCRARHENAPSRGTAGPRRRHKILGVPVMERFESILVDVDAAAAVHPELDRAVSLARRCGASLTIVDTTSTHAANA